MGQKLTLTDTTFSDATLPVLRDDEGLNNGSLAMLDLTHSFVTTAGVPNSGDTVYNIAWKQAATLLGSGDVSTLAFPWLNTFVSSEAKFERTGKGALHGVVSQSAQGGHAAYFNIPDPVAERLRANPARDIALFMWADVTRIAITTNNLYEAGIGASASYATNQLLSSGLANSIGKSRLSVDKPTGWQGTPPANVSIMAKALAAWGNIQPYNSLNANDGRSFILYRAHLVDVAASGMTFAQLDAADSALYTKLFASGGRYYGDSHSLDPAGTP